MTISPAHVAFALYTIPLTGALSSYTTNCTLPPADVTSGFYYVSTPNVRGSLDIIWLCLWTLIICCYKVLHLNVKPSRYRIIKTLGLSLLAILAPEVILTESIIDLRCARKHLQRFKSCPALQGHHEEWTLTHMFYANAYGFILRAEGENKTLDAEALLAYIEAEQVDKSPSLTKEEIDDKSKDDGFTKALAIAQITYFYVDFFARIAQRKATSQLELSVASIAVYSLASYLCIWYKPKGVETPTYIGTTEPTGTEPQVNKDIIPDRAQSEELSPRRSTSTQQAGLHTDKQSRMDGGTTGIHNSDPLTTCYSSDGKAPRQQNSPSYRNELSAITFGRFLDSDWEGVILLLISIPLGAVHLAAWNFNFPSTADCWLWRISAIVCTATGISLICIVIASGALAICFSQSYAKLTESIGIFVLYATIALYFIARIILIVESIRCLFFLPASAFQTTTWAASIPHFG